MYQHAGNLCSSLDVYPALSRPEGFSGSPLWSPNLRTTQPQSWSGPSTAAARWQTSSPMTSVYDTERCDSIWLVRLRACREDGRVRASLDAGLLSALLGVVSFRSTVDVGPRNFAPHHERRRSRRMLQVKVACQLTECADHTSRHEPLLHTLSSQDEGASLNWLDAALTFNWSTLGL